MSRLSGGTRKYNQIILLVTKLGLVDPRLVEYTKNCILNKFVILKEPQNVTAGKQILKCACSFQVRAAAVFALGKFIANTGDRSDQANNIDFGVAMTLTSLTQDGSPLVRKVWFH